MNKFEKFFKKISKKDRIFLGKLIDNLLSKNKTIKVEKLKGADFYKLKKIRFRVIFHYRADGGITIDSIKLRDNNLIKVYNE